MHVGPLGTPVVSPDRMSRTALPLSILATALLGIGSTRPQPPAAEASTSPRHQGIPPFLSGSGNWADSVLSTLSLDERIAQLMMVAAYSNKDARHEAEIESMVRDRGIGGLIFFQGGPARQARLTNRYQSAARAPLLLGMDLEWGLGMRLDSTMKFPHQMALGAVQDDSLIEAMGSEIARQMRRLGVHVSFSPVVDVNNNPANPVINDRSFGEDRENVARKAVAYMRGLQNGGVIATAKHFPGHGDTSQDSHSLLPTITAGLDRLKRVELFPFQAAIDAGVKSVMTAHLAVPALDPTPGLPATLSEAIMTGLLRRQMGFKGLIVTDALEMGGVTAAYSTEEAALRAVLAGVDQLLLPPEPAKVIAYLAAAVRDGRMPLARIDGAVRRILEAKASVGLARSRYVDAGALRRRVASQASLDLAARMLERSVTLVRNEAGALPLAAAPDRLAVLSLSSDLGDYFAGQAFAGALLSRFPRAAAFYADADTGQDRLEEAFARAGAADVVVVGLFSRLSDRKGSVGLEARHIDLVNRLAALPDGPKVVAVSFGSPYLLRHIPGVDAYLCLYKDTADSQAAAARALCGEADVTGRLPVSIPGLYPVGHGLDLKRRTS